MSFLINLHTLASGLETRGTEKVSIKGQMEMFMKEISSMMSRVGKESSHMQMVIGMLGDGNTTSRMSLVDFRMQMAITMKVDGKRVFSMVLER